MGIAFQSSPGVSHAYHHSFNGSQTVVASPSPSPTPAQSKDFSDLVIPMMTKLTNPLPGSNAMASNTTYNVLNAFPASNTSSFAPHPNALDDFRENAPKANHSIIGTAISNTNWSSTPVHTSMSSNGGSMNPMNSNNHHNSNRLVPPAAMHQGFPITMPPNAGV